MKYNIINGSISLNGEPIIDEINININSNSHIGIIGRNGTGKTTLLNALIDNNMLDEGLGDDKFQIIKIGSFSIGYQKQVLISNENNILLDEIRSSFKEIIDLEDKINKLSNNLSNDTNIKEYTNLLEKYKYLGGYTYEKEYKVMLNKFGFTTEDLNKPISSFSGGERTKIAFIKLLLSKPDLLLLDEPTNHLDIDTVEWLENFLKNYTKSFVIVSHDRMFLNNTVNEIYEIENYRTEYYKGNYDYYEKEHLLRYEKNVKEYNKEQKEIDRLYNLYLRFRSKPKKAKMALSRLNMIKRMDVIDKPERIDTNTFKVNFKDIIPSGKKVLTMKNLSFGYNFQFGKITTEIMRGEHLGIIGANGTGKSTLLKTISGIIEPLDGTYIYGVNVNVGYFDQNITMIDDKNSVLEEFRETYKELDESECRKYLAAYNFRGDDVYKKVSLLSGGEKVRLELAKIFYKKPNLLILDEPTNHLDIIGKEYFEDLLSLYKGTIIFVSHDRYFINKIATRLIIIKNNNIEYYNDTYQKYLEEKNIKNNEILLENKKIKKKNQKVIDSNNKKDNIYELKKNLNKIENQIVSLEVKKKNFEVELLNPNIYNNYVEANNIKEHINKISDELDILNKEWEELTTKILENS